MVLQYRKRQFPGLYCLKKKVGRRAIFALKPWVNPFGKMSIFRPFWTSCFYSLERRFFVLEYRKNTFSWLILPKKKKIRKMANFGPKLLVNPFWKNLSFSTFRTFCFYRLQRRFFDVENRKIHFPSLYCIKKKVGKRAIFGPKPWVNPFGKMSIFPIFWTSCFYGLEIVFLV